MEKVDVRSWDDVEENFESFLKGEKKGVIRLAVPVANVLEWGEGIVSAPEALLGLSRQEMERVLYYGRAFRNGRVLGLEASCSADVQADAMGAKPLMDALGAMAGADIESARKAARRDETAYMAELERLAEKIEAAAADADDDGVEADTGDASDARETSGEAVGRVAAMEAEYAEAQRKLKAVRRKIEALYDIEANGPSRMFLTEIEVMPIRVRSALSEGRRRMCYSVMHDVLRLYARVAGKNAHVLRMKELGAPDIIIRNECRLLQEYVDQLLCNGRRGAAYVGRDGERLASLSDVIARVAVA